MDIEKELQKYIDDFRFQVVDDNDMQRSSTWSIKHDDKSVYIFVRSQGGKMKLSFHPINSGDDGNDSQYGLVSNHRSDLKDKGFTVPDRVRWKRPNNKEKIKRIATLLFPTDHMNGEVYQFIKEKKPKVSLPMAPAGHTVEVSIFSHYQSPEMVEEKLIQFLYTPIYYMTLKSGEMVTVAARQTSFDRSSLPKAGSYSGHKLTKTEIKDTKFMHAICHNDPKDYEPICLIEINGFKLNN